MSFSPTYHEEVAVWMNDYFRNISEEIQALTFEPVREPIHVEPTKFFDGQLVFADGTDFDPGKGRGIYYFDFNVGPAGDWVFVGINETRLLDLLLGRENTDQIPPLENVPIQVTFGPPQILSDVTLDANGLITFLVEDEFEVRVHLAFGRQSGGGPAILWVRALIDGVQIGASSANEVDDGQDLGTDVFFDVVNAVAGTEMTVELYRDGGATSAGLIALTSGIGWNPAPSAEVHIFRTILL